MFTKNRIAVITACAGLASTVKPGASVDTRPVDNSHVLADQNSSCINPLLFKTIGIVYVKTDTTAAQPYTNSGKLWKQEISNKIEQSKGLPSVPEDILREVTNFDLKYCEDLKKVIVKLFDAFPNDEALHRVVAQKVLREFEANGVQIPVWGRMASCFRLSTPETNLVLEKIEQHILKNLQPCNISPALHRRLTRIAEAATALGRTESPIIKCSKFATSTSPVEYVKHEGTQCTNSDRWINGNNVLIPPRTLEDTHRLDVALYKVSKNQPLTANDIRRLLTIDFTAAEDQQLLIRNGVYKGPIQETVEAGLLSLAKSQDLDSSAQTKRPGIKDLTDLFCDASKIINRQLMRKVFPEWLSTECQRIAFLDDYRLYSIIESCRKLCCTDEGAMRAIGNKIAATAELQDPRAQYTHMRLIVNYVRGAADMGHSHRFDEILPKALKLTIESHVDASQVRDILECCSVLKLRGWKTENCCPQAIINQLAESGVVKNANLNSSSSGATAAYARLRDLAFLNDIERPIPLGRHDKSRLAHSQDQREELNHIAAAELKKAGISAVAISIKLRQFDSLWVDMYVEGPTGNCVIECDGCLYHTIAGAPESTVRGKDLIRDALLAKASIPYIHVTSNEIKFAPEKFIGRVQKLIDSTKATSIPS